MSSSKCTIFTLIFLFYGTSKRDVIAGEVSVSKIHKTNDFSQLGAPPNQSKTDHFNFITEDFKTPPAPKELKATSRVTASLNWKLSTLITRIDAIKSIPLIGKFISIAKIRDYKAEVGRDEGLSAKMKRYLRSHSIRVCLPEEVSRSAGHATKLRVFDFGLEKLAALSTSEGRGRIKKLILPIVLLLIVKFILLLPVFLSGIALVSLNGLWAGVTALFVATALGLRALFGRDPPGYAPRVAVFQPSFQPSFQSFQPSFHSFQPQYIPSDTVQVHADLVPVWSRNGVQPELAYKGHPPIAKQ